uniref:Inter-alpha-trypsin inhibitor heavy chain H3 n=1 Tax=Sphaeramia orbicularis TaxID=375764 RepID=A0A673BBH5_9TELE
TAFYTNYLHVLIGLYNLLNKYITPFQEVEVYSVTVGCTVMSRFAHTVMTSKALNKANFSQEIFFEVELPKTAFITNFSMEIEGQIYIGEVKEKAKAKKEYDKAVSKGQTAGLVKASGRTMEKFSVSVNIAAKSNVTFTLTYEELLKRKLGQYEILTRVKPKQLVQEFKIVADIYEPQGIAFVEAIATFLSNDLLPLKCALVINIFFFFQAHISFSPTLEQQRRCPECEGTVIDGDFIIKYDVKRGEDLGEIQIVNGYFVHFFAPPDLPRLPVNVVFVIDRSGSMGGAKMLQTREALKAILNDLHEEDHFALIIFDNDVATWKNRLTKATKTNVDKAKAYVAEIKDRGSTNILEPVLRAVNMLKKDQEATKIPERSVDMIILLTDGMPNAGVTDPEGIQEGVSSAIAGTMSLFCLGFGNDVQYSFLDVLARQNKGLARRIFVASDAAVQLQGFYEEVSRPLLLNVDLQYSDTSVDSLTKNHFNHLFEGSEIIVAGRLSDNDVDNLQVKVLGQGVRDGLHALEIGTQQEQDNATQKALDMSLRYSFVTPLTSMVITKPETEPGKNSPLIADKLTEGEGNSGSYQHFLKFSSKSGTLICLGGGLHSPSASSLIYYDFSPVDGDPHFLIELPDRDDALCFNINDKPGTILNLVKDPKSGFVVNGEIIGKKKVVDDGKVNTYFGRFGIIHWTLGVRLEVSTQDISVFQDSDQFRLLWSDTASLKGPNLHLKLAKNCSLTVTLKHSVKFMIIKHTKVWKRRHDQQDYLGFYTLDSHHMSSSVHGLLGQFYHGVNFEVTDVHQAETQDEHHAVMYVKGQTLNVTRHWQRDFSQDLKDGKNISCWFVNDNGAGLVDGAVTDYIMSDLFETV